MFSDPTMTFDETLAEVLGMVGRHVDVTIHSRDPGALIATFGGTLARGHDIRHESRADEGEVFLFVMAEDQGRGFLIEARVFGGAGYVTVGSGKGVLEIRAGSSIITVDGRGED